MQLSENYDDLKRRLEGLGYSSPELDSRLRNGLLSAREAFIAYHEETVGNLKLECWFNFEANEAGGRHELLYYEATLRVLANIDLQAAGFTWRSFDKDVPKSRATEVLLKTMLTLRRDDDPTL